MNYQELKTGFVNTTDGTYDLLTGQAVSFNSGYQVSFETTNDDYSDDEYNDLVGFLSKTHGTPCIGVWGGVKELSFHITEYRQALLVATIYSQDAIWDWSNMEAINLKD